MSKLIYTSYSPNTRKKDLLANLKLLFNPSSWIKGSATSQIEGIFTQKLNGAKAYTFNYARSGMYVLFKTLELKNTDEVIMQGFTCIAAVNPINWAGAKASFADIDEATLNLSVASVEKQLTENTRAVLFQHTFGNSSGIEEISEFCKKHQLYLIEDCTNTIFGTHRGKLIGTFSDAAIFSLGRDKAVSGVDGGVIVINNEKISEKFELLYKNIPLPTKTHTLRELLYPVIWATIKSTYNLKLGKLIHFTATKLKLITRATSLEEKFGNKPDFIPQKLANALARLAVIQLEDITLLNQHRIKLSQIYKNTLIDSKTTKIDFIEGNVPLRYPIISANKTKLVAFLKANNILVGDWYDKPITPIATALSNIGYNIGQCPTSEKVCKNIFNLPTHINISEEDAIKICGLINNYGN